jgi:hypothetical protein
MFFTLRWSTKKELITYLDIGFSTSLAILSRLLLEREWMMLAAGSFVYFTVSAQKEIYMVEEYLKNNELHVKISYAFSLPSL